MPRIVLIDSPDPVLWLRYAGVVTLEQRRCALDRAIELALSANCFRALVDYRSAHSFEHDEVATKGIASKLSERLAGRQLRIAWLVRFDYQLDDSIERSISGLGIPTARFCERDKALEWLAGASEQLHGERAANDVADPLPVSERARSGVELIERAVDADVRLRPTQFAALVRLAEDLMKSGLDEVQILSMVQTMVQAMAAGSRRKSTAK